MNLPEVISRDQLERLCCMSHCFTLDSTRTNYLTDDLKDMFCWVELFKI